MVAFQNQRLIAHDDDNIRVDRWFKRHFPDLPHARLSRMLRTGQVRLDGGRIGPSDRLSQGQTLRLPPEAVLTAALVDFSAQTTSKPVKVIDLRPHVLYEDSHIIALNKPSGLATQGGTGMKTSVDDSLSSLGSGGDTSQLRLVHRLDKDTSGVLLLAKSAKTADTLMKQFQTKAIEKTYLAIVAGAVRNNKGSIVQPLLKKDAGGHEKMHVDEAGQYAETHYRVEDRFDDIATLLRLIPHTGRTHQLRVHCAHLGLPIVGDGKYGGGEAFPFGRPFALQLHAWRIQLPAIEGEGEVLTLTAPLPLHIVDTCHRCGWDVTPFRSWF